MPFSKFWVRNPKLPFNGEKGLVVIRAGFEPTTDRLEICCSIQLSYRTKFQLILPQLKKKALQSRAFCRGCRIRTCDPLLPKQMRYRAALNPEFGLKVRREGDSNPRYPLEVRQFSKLLVSATHPSLR